MIASPRRQWVRRLGAVAALAAVALLGSIGPAVAHGDEGRMQLEVTPSGPVAAFVRATVIFENDSEPALGAAVTVEATGPEGQTLPATPLTEAGDGRYEATLTFPVAGTWTVRAVATDPAATGEVTAAITEAVAATTTTTVPEVEIAESRRARASDEDDGSSLVVPIVAVAVIGLGGALAAWLLQRRRSSA